MLNQERNDRSQQTDEIRKIPDANNHKSRSLIVVAVKTPCAPIPNSPCPICQVFVLDYSLYGWYHVLVFSAFTRRPGDP
jgi:hypothetical protein